MTLWQFREMIENRIPIVALLGIVTAILIFALVQMILSWIKKSE